MNFSTDPINNVENLQKKNRTKTISIYLVVVLAIIVFLIALPFIYVDISSQSRGILRSKMENVPITSVISGEVQNLTIFNNKEVKRGDTLLTIVKKRLLVDAALNDTLYFQNKQMFRDLEFVLNEKVDSLKTAVIREDYFKFNNQRQALKSKLLQAQVSHKRYKTLYDKSVVAKVEYERYYFQMLNAQNDLKSFVTQQMATWQNQKNELQLQLKNLEGAVNKISAETNNYIITAPVNGTIENFSGAQMGDFVMAGQPIAILSPHDSLIVESTVSPKDIGLIKIGEPVKFQLDAFNYNQWGLITGKVIDIDKNITLQNNQAFFKVRCSLDSNYLKLKSGYQTKVSKGMTLTTRYIITRRSLYELLFDKIDDWLNPKIITN